MKKILEQRLYKTFPVLYKQKDLSPRKTCMCWGITCGDGWFNIIWDLSEKIEKYNETLKTPIEAIQVKQKFGGLRFYTNYITGEVSNWIREAENECYETCEMCGSKDKVKRRGNGWIETLCDKCTKKFKLF